MPIEQTYGYILSIIYRSGERAVGRWGRREKAEEKKGGREEVRGSQGKVRMVCRW